MAKHELRLPGGGEYALVADRITLFYERHPEGRIITELVSRSGGEITFRALVYRSPAEREPSSTGWASEREGDGDVNVVACLENTETSAIGRALANLGFTASRQRASAEEMAKASRARALRAGSARTQPLRVAEPTPSSAAPADDLHRDDLLRADLRLLLEQAERAGVKPARLATVRETLDRPGVGRAELERLERGVRAWLARRKAPPARATDGAGSGVAGGGARDDVRGGALQG